MLRARSAVQRFPVVEWRQRMEDFHRRSITTSRGLAGANAFRTSDCDGGHGRAIADHDDWNPEFQAHPTQPNWDVQSVNEVPRSPGPPVSPGSPGAWSQDTVAAGDALHVPPRLLPDGRRASFTTDGGSDSESGYFNQNQEQRQDFGNFLERANRTIAKDQKHAPDPFLDAGPSRPFGAHSRASSVESIASIVDEKANSPLNKAIASVCFDTLAWLVVVAHHPLYQVHRL